MKGGADHGEKENRKALTSLGRLLKGTSLLKRKSKGMT